MDKDSRVVDQDVEAAEPLDGGLAHPRDGGAIAEVGRGGKGTASRRLDRIDCRPGSLFAARVNRHVRALAREGLGDGGADAARRPGNKGAAAVKRSLHYRLPVMLHGGVGRRPARSAQRPADGESTGESRYRLAVMMSRLALSCQK